VRFLSDVHITIKLSKRLEQLGHQSEHVNNMLDKWHTQDRDIITYIDAHEGILITKDQDFRNSYLLNRTPRKLIKINLGNISNEALLQIIETHIDRISELDEQHTSFMIEINKDGYWIVTK
jgi:predicted nuclease of predicted toxin-antitoxin system